MALENQVKVDAVKLSQAMKDLMGWCPDCRDFTTPGTMPDHVAKACFDCGSTRVVGGQILIDSGVAPQTEVVK